MIKKILPFVLIITVLVSAMITPVSATSGSSVNILDFASLPNGQNTFAVKGKATAKYSLANTLQSVRTYYVDIVFVSTGIAISSIVINRDGSNDFNGTITQLAPSLYRVTCDMGGLVAKTFNLKFSNNGSSYSYITILSFDVHSIPSNRVGIGATVTAVPGNEVIKQPGYSCQVQTQPVVADKYATSYVNITVSESYWKDFDYIDLDGRISCYNINSISVLSSNGTFIPLVHNFINTGLIDNEETTRANFYYSCRVDLTSLDKSAISGNLQIRFSIEEYNSSLFSLYNLAGIVIGEPVDVQATWYQILFRSIEKGFDDIYLLLRDTYFSLSNWFDNLFAKFDSLIQSLVPSSVDNNVTNDIQQSDNALGDLSNDIDSLSPTVDAGSIDVDIGGYVDPDSSTQANNILISITSQSFVQTMFLILASFSLIGYIFFGKR